MKRLLLCLVLAAAAAAAAPAKAQADTRPPLTAYEGDAAYQQLICQVKFRIAEQSSELNKDPGEQGDFRRCIADGRFALRKAYERAAKTVNKPAARAALKEHYIAVIGALEGINPQLSEMTPTYRTRQSANKARVDDAWIRFEAER